jgi:hypothetical protein
MNLTSILYAIGFTFFFCLFLFLGYSPDVSIFQQGLLVFAGFCLGGIAVLIFENWEYA